MKKLARDTDTNTYLVDQRSECSSVAAISVVNGTLAYSNLRNTALTEFLVRDCSGTLSFGVNGRMPEALTLQRVNSKQKMLHHLTPALALCMRYGIKI